MAHAEATDEESRAENKYDTRGLEASYLAHGQSRQVAETEQARDQYAALLPLPAGAPQGPIGVGALVQLETGDERPWYFLGPAAGGMEIQSAGQEVFVVTPLSPFGRLLVGKRQGEQVWLGHDGYRIVQVV